MLALLIAAFATQPPQPFALDDYPPRHQTVRGLVDGDDPATTRRRRGVWPIANGRTFAYVGYGEPANRMFMITGPQYQTRRNHEPEGSFGQLWLELVDEAGPCRVVERTWTEASRAAAVRTEEDWQRGHRTVVTDFAHASLPVLFRQIRVHARRQTTLAVRMGAAPDGSPDADDGTSLRKSYRKGRETFRLRVALHGDPERRVIAEESNLRIPLDAGEHDLCLALVTSRSAAEERDILTAIRGQSASSLRDRALQSWRQELHGTLTASPPTVITKTIESVKKLTWAQRSRPSGGVAPMVSFKGIWARDSNGPILTWLWAGRPDLVRDLLTYYRKVSALRGRTDREYPLDVDVSSTSEPPGGWSTTGTDRCEVPNWIVLQHAWLWHRTGDAAFARSHWPWVKQNLEQQESTQVGDTIAQSFNGDETYLHGAFYSLFPGRRTWPNEFPKASAWSLDSLLGWLAATRAAGALARDEPPAWFQQNDARARLLTRSIDAFWMADAARFAPARSPVDRRLHRAPFAPINLRPLWLETHVDDPRGTQNLLSTAALLMREDGMLRMTPSVGFFIGALPGYWLANLAAIDHPLAWEVLPRVLASCGPSGAWSEIHEPGTPGWGYGDGRLPNRYRPWESGIVLDGLMRFLTGARFENGNSVTLRPRRPHDIPLERLGPLRIGKTAIELRYPERGSSLVQVHHLSGPEILVNGMPLGENATVAVPMARPRDWDRPRARPFDGALALPAGRRLVITTQPHRAPTARADDVVLDAGLPFRPEHLAAALFDSEGRRRFEVVVLEAWATRATRDTMKLESFWTDGELADAFARFERLGGTIESSKVLEDWWLCGPFPNPESRGLFEEARPVEQIFDTTHEFAVEGWRDPAKWIRRRAGGDGRMDLHLPNGPSDEICVFARTTIESQQARRAELLLGTDDGCRVWLNGDLVFESIEHRHLTPDQFAIPIRLRAGPNVLVVGVEDRIGGFGLCARVR